MSPFNNLGTKLYYLGLYCQDREGYFYLWAAQDLQNHLSRSIMLCTRPSSSETDGDQFHAFIIKNNSETVITNIIIISHNYRHEKIESESESERRRILYYIFHLNFSFSLFHFNYQILVLRHAASSANRN